MRLTLRLKLVVSFLIVIIITGSIATFIGSHLIDKGIVREAQSKVTLDLNSARQIYTLRLRDIEKGMVFTAMREFGVKKALQEKNIELLKESLYKTRKEGGMDICAITDKNGNVILRAHNPEVFGDSQAQDELVKKAILHKRSVAGTEIVTREELLKESKFLAEKAQIKLVPTPRGKEGYGVENTSGMMLKAAVPILDDTGELIGVLYGGVLLNSNYEIVDKIKHVVYEKMKYKGKDIGTATIFQDGFRISTNVVLHNGERAIGTIVSKEVYERVVEQGKVWTDRAFVVNDWYLTAYSPIKNIDGDVIGMLYVGMLESKYNDMKRQSLLMFFGVIITGIILSLVVSYILANLIVKPIQELKGGVEALAKGDFDFEINVHSQDEIGGLEESFNKVRQELKQTYNKLQGKIEAADEDLKKAYKELREKQELLVQKERLASIGQLSAGVAHEINNPIGTIVLFSHTLLKQFPEGDQRREDLEVIVNEAMRCKDIIHDLLNFARQSRVSKESTDFVEFINDILSIMKPDAERAGVKLEAQFDEPLPLMMIDKTQIQQVFVNLIKNSIDATSSEGKIKIFTKVCLDGKSIEVNVIDNGCGIKYENLSKLFTPFFTTKDMGKGTGLGLAIAYGVIKMHAGNITVDSELGKGTTFTIHLPINGNEKNDNKNLDTIYTHLKRGKEADYYV